MGVPAAAMDAGRVDLMHSLKGMGNKRLLKAEEKKKKGGIGVATKAKSSEQKSPPSTAKAAAKPTASELLAVKLRKKETVAKSQPPAVRSVAEVSREPARCSTTDDELEALFSAIDKEITDDPDAALDLLEMMEMIENAKVEIESSKEDDLIKLMDKLEDDEC